MEWSDSGFDEIIEPEAFTVAALLWIKFREYSAELQRYDKLLNRAAVLHVFETARVTDGRLKQICENEKKTLLLSCIFVSFLEINSSSSQVALLRSTADHSIMIDTFKFQIFFNVLAADCVQTLTHAVTVPCRIPPVCQFHADPRQRLFASSFTKRQDYVRFSRLRPNRGPFLPSISKYWKCWYRWLFLKNIFE